MRAWHSALAALRWPLFWATSELLADCLQYFTSEPWWYARAYRDFDRDCVLYALTPLVPILRAWYRWKRHRWCAERLGKRLGLFDVREGALWASGCWRLAFWRTWEARLQQQREASRAAIVDAYDAGRNDGARDLGEKVIAMLDAKLKPLSS